MKKHVAIGVGILLGAFCCLAAISAQTPPSSAAQADRARIDAGKRLFADTCQNDHCHGGSARNMEDHSGFTAERLTRVITEGVPDAGMQAFKGVYTPEQVEQLVAYILSVSADAGASAGRTAPQLAPAHSVTTREITSSRLVDAGKEPQNWLTYFGNYAAWSYSSLDQVTRQNVKRLVPVWAFSTGELRGGLMATPLVADGVMYLMGPRNRVFALDAVTGRQIWKYFYELPDGPVPYQNGSRGVAIGYGLVYFGSLDNHVVALDAKTGREVWQIEIEDVRQCGCNVTSAPLLVKDKVIVGVTAGDSAHRGYLNAYDAKTGKHLWRFYTIPAAGEPGNETWAGDSWKLGGGSTWFTGSYDPELNLVYWGVGNASSDYFGEDRQGENLYTASLIALDADTGKLKWYFQETPHDVYDYDSNAEPMLIDVTGNGQTRKLVVHASKNGFAYVLDRVTGTYVAGWPYVDELNWTKGLDRNGKPIDQVIPPAGKRTDICPGGAGGRNWQHAAYSPRTGWYYNTSFEFCETIEPKRQEAQEGDRWMANAGNLRHPSATAKPHIDAFDPVTGKKAWTYRTKYMNLSSLLATAGDLLFGGDPDGDAWALDATTGERLWSFNTGGGISSAPMAYAVNGRQYIAIGSGMGALHGGYVPRWWPEAPIPPAASTLFVFALPNP